MPTSERKLGKLIRTIVILLIMPIVVGIVNPCLEYWSGLFRLSPSDETAFDGALTIAVADASRYHNQVTAIVSSPGFQEERIEEQRVGYRVIYKANAKYEIQIVGVADSSSWQNIPATATFTVTKFR